MPTFLIFRNGREAERIQGANASKLQDAVRRLAREAEGMSSSSSSSSKSWIGTIPTGFSDITDQIDIKGLDLLNGDSETGGVRTLFDGATPSALSSKGKKKAESTKKDWVESDTDDQLMLFMPFQSTLKIRNLYITSIPPTDTQDDDDEVPMRPKTIKLFANHPNNLGFEDATGGIEPTQSITLEVKDWDKETGTAKIDLRYVRFQKISTLVLFVENGDGDGEKVRIDRIKLVGETGEKKGGQVKKIEDE